MLKDDVRTSVFRELLADFMDVPPAQIMFTFDTLEGDLSKDDSILDSLQKLKAEPDEEE